MVGLGSCSKSICPVGCSIGLGPNGEFERRALSCRSGRHDRIDRVRGEELAAGGRYTVDVLVAHPAEPWDREDGVPDRDRHPLAQGEVAVGRDDRGRRRLLEAQPDAVADPVHVVVAEPATSQDLAGERVEVRDGRPGRIASRTTAITALSIADTRW